MILIDKISVKEVPHNICEIAAYSYTPERDILDYSPGIPMNRMEDALSVTKEQITGRRFQNGVGKAICIGMSKQVQVAIGLPFEAFDNMNKQIDRLWGLNYDLTERYSKFPIFDKIFNVLSWLLERYGRNY